MGIVTFFVFLIQLFSYYIFKSIVQAVGSIFEVRTLPFFLIIIFLFIFSNKSCE